MHTFLTIALVLSLWLIPSGLNTAGQADAQQRAQELAASFNKTKHKVKERRGIRIDIFLEVRNQPVVRGDARAYAGTYEAMTGNVLKLEVGAGGHLEVSGSEPGPEHDLQFTLRDARIEGALLLGTKVYQDGSTEKFEAVFINRTERNDPAAGGVTTFGLGVVYDPPKVSDDYGFTLNHLFYEMK